MKLWNTFKVVGMNFNNEQNSLIPFLNVLFFMYKLLKFIAVIFFIFKIINFCCRWKPRDKWRQRTAIWASLCFYSMISSEFCWCWICSLDFWIRYTWCFLWCALWWRPVLVSLLEFFLSCFWWAAWPLSTFWWCSYFVITHHKKWVEDDRYIPLLRFSS